MSTTERTLSAVKREILARRLRGEGAPKAAEIPRRGAADAPLSFAQQRLWFLDRYLGGSGAYNVYAAHLVEGPLDEPALDRAFVALTTRHEALRTVFEEREGEPRQRVLPPPGRVVEVDELEDGSLEPALERARAEAARSFDLERERPLRALLLRLAPERRVLVTVIHHIACDGWSVERIEQELEALYRAELARRPAGLPELELRYADYAHWQREAGDERLERELAYWRSVLGPEPPALELPTDRPRPAEQRYAGARTSRRLAAALTSRLRALGDREQATLYMTLLTGFAALLARLSGQRRLQVGTPVAGRTRSELEPLVGFFVNTLVLPFELDFEASFRDALRDVKARSLEAFAHQELPYERLVEELRPPRDPSRNALFQAMFAYEYERAPLALDGVTVRELDVDNGTSKFDVTLFVAEQPDGLEAVLEYDGELFEPGTAALYLARLERLLEAAVADPDAPLGELDLLPAEERERLATWSRGDRLDVEPRTLGPLVSEQAGKTPDRVALVHAEDELSYAELEARSNRLARELVARGVGPEQLVGVYLGRSPTLLVALLGILKAGAAYLPLDPAYPADRLAFMLSDAASPLLLAERRLADRLPPGAPATLVLDEEADRLARHPTTPPPERAAPDDLAYAIYTSGSTGKPKGVVITHRSAAAFLAWCERFWSDDEMAAVLASTSICFDLSVFELFAPLCRGGSVVLVEDALALASLESPPHVTLINTVPSAMAELVRADAVPAGVLAVNLAGEQLPARLARDVLTRTSARRLLNLYGPSEATTYATWADVPGDGSKPLVGRPIDGTEAHVLDERLRPAPIGVAGELYVGGAGLARGYLRRPALTAERFGPAPEGGPGERLYRTGDLARRRADGQLEYLGRGDQQVKIRGFRIELGEVEAALAAHPEVRECAVVCRGEETEKRLYAYLVPCAAAPPPEQLRAHLRRTLPEHMVPAVFQALPELPLTANGKIDRKRLPEPDQGRPELEAAFRPPRNPVEHALAALWTELLGVDRVGIDDNFFALGGDSILSLQILARAAEDGIKLTPSQIFRHQTIAELAAAAERAPASHAAQEPVSGPAPLAPVQRWFLDAEPAVPGHFNQAVLVRADEPLDPELVHRAWAELHVHHDQLRACYRRRDGGWEQTIEPPDRVTAPPPEREAGDDAVARLQASLRLDEPPLTRLLLLDERTLLGVCHHLNVDAVSWRILLEDLERAYRQLRDGQPVRLPPKTCSYRDWTRGLAEHASGARAAAELDHWRSVAESPPTPLPADHDLGPNTAASAAEVEVTLDERETAALLRDVPAAYRTEIADVLLAALAAAFRERTGSDELLVELEGHGREDVFGLDVSRTVGWFTSLYPVRLDLAGTDGPADELKAVKRRLRAVPGRGVGYGLLRYLHAGDETDVLRAAPSPAIVFNYLGRWSAEESGRRLLRIVHDSPGPTQAPDNVRPHVLSVDGGVEDGRLRVTFEYSRNVHGRETIEALAGAFVAALRRVLDRAAEGPSDYEAADFADVALGDEELASVLGELEDAL